MITSRERQLMLRYGYPFDDIQRQLLESGDADLARVTDIPFYWEQVIINLRISEEEKSEFRVNKFLAPSVVVLIKHIAIQLGLT